MFSYVWRTGQTINVPEHNSKYRISAVLPLLWIEHCVECAAPLCYKSCSIYKKRIDGRCLRFENGVHPIHFSDGTLGGQLSFRRWAKLEGSIGSEVGAINYNRIKRITCIFNTIGLLCNQVLNTFRIPWHKHRPNKVLESLLAIYFRKRKWRVTASVDGFLISVYNHRLTPCTLLLEIIEDNRSIFKHAFKLQPQWNEEFLPIEMIPIQFTNKQLVRIYLEGIEQGRFTFKNLDFVSLAKNTIGEEHVKPASKIKCVAWDLDNTLWEGVIGDTDNDNVKIRPDAIELIKLLDQRGILQTIVSKNTYDIAWNKIKTLGIDEYFLYPAINWGRKSKNLLAISKELNINIDTFALIDDSTFERNEVSDALPQVRTYDAIEIPSLLQKNEFQVPITTESAKRRQSYLVDRERKIIKASYGLDYDSFLRDCQIHLRMFRPSSEEEKLRCMELLQRSNQYNIALEKRDKDGFEQIYNNESYQMFAIQVYDKFGDYGIVGFASVEKTSPKEYYVRDFVMSCRVAQKKVERAFFNNMIKGFQNDDIIKIHLFKTQRNKPLQNEIKQMPFSFEDKDDYLKCQYLVSKGTFVDDDIIIIDINE